MQDILQILPVTGYCLTYKLSVVTSDWNLTHKLAKYSVFFTLGRKYPILVGEPRQGSLSSKRMHEKYFSNIASTKL